MIRIVFVLSACVLSFTAVVARADSNNASFDERVAPVLIRRCVGCHSGGDPKGGFNLSRKSAAMAGGDSGVVIVPEKPKESVLWQRVRDEEMPPEKPLPEDEKKILEQWIAGGAAWGTDPLDPFRFTTDKRAGYDWWALQPVQRPPLPEVQDRAWPRNAVDDFVLAKLEENGLAPSPEAEKRTLIRRLSFDLTGLPPSSEEVAAFVTDDRPDAYERLVDRLLASPHYGVRMGRAWLDVVRFGESQGFERDKLREDAWPYRDWVIDAFNADLPYDEFIRLQIAGDVLHPDNAAAVTATGFLVAGPYDEVGQQQQSAAMKAVVRQDELEDLTSVVGESFLGLTVHCARCHDHKFDPIRQREYYQMAAALDGVHHGERQVDTPENARRREGLKTDLEIVRNQLAALDRSVRNRILDNDQQRKDTAAPAPMARWSFDESRDEAGSLHASLDGGARLENGALIADGKSAFAATVPLTKDLREKTLEAWVRLDNLEQAGGGVISVQTLDGAVFDAIVFGEREPQRWMAGSDSFRRTKPLEAPAETEANERVVHVAAVYRYDGTIAFYRDGQPYGKPYKSDGPVTFGAGKAQVVFGLRHSPPGGNRLLAGAIHAAQLYDRALSDDEIAASAAAGESITRQRLIAAMTSEEKERHEELRRRISLLEESLESLKPGAIYAVSPTPPGVSHVLLRGNPAAKGGDVAPGGIASLVGVTADFGLPADASDAKRRAKLAAWIANPSNPLTARVMVNRLWLHHFGAGLVDTPSDFGFNGARPTHPELLDHLATEFVAGGWSVKRMQRMIVTSAAYRQSSIADFGFRIADSKNDNPQSAIRNPQLVDADNRLLWRKSPRRLEAEELRDAILSVAGELNETLGGPGFRDFTTYVQNTQFYEMLDPVGPEYNRRSVYRTWIRSGRSRFLDAFDCPDPSTKTPKRAVTVTPLQALSLLNNSFALRMSARMAERLHREAGDEVPKQIERAFQLACGRAPSPDETATIEPFIREHGLPEFCRVVLNSNEFLYVE